MTAGCRQLYNPNYLGGRDQEDHSSKPWAKSFEDPILKITHTHTHKTSQSSLNYQKHLIKPIIPSSVHFRLKGSKLPEPYISSFPVFLADTALGFFWQHWGLNSGLARQALPHLNPIFLLLLGLGFELRTR
jgi:hypothetical protein